MAFAFMIVYNKKRPLLIKFISSGRKLSRLTPKRTGLLYLLFFILLYLKTEGLFAVKIIRASRLEGFLLDHETIIRTGITCKKILYYMHDSACRWFIVQKAKIFWIMLNIFEFSLVWENVEAWSMQISFFQLPNHISRLT